MEKEVRKKENCWIWSPFHTQAGRGDEEHRLWSQTVELEPRLCLLLGVTLSLLLTSQGLCFLICSLGLIMAAT